MKYIEKNPGSVPLSSIFYLQMIYNIIIVPCLALFLFIFVLFLRYIHYFSSGCKWPGIYHEKRLNIVLQFNYQSFRLFVGLAEAAISTAVLYPWQMRMLVQSPLGKSHPFVRGLLCTTVPEIIDPVFAKTSPKRSFCLTENERFGLVFGKTGFINSGTVLLAETPATLPLPPHLGSYTRVLLVSKDRQ
jgi:hypothetical protein